MDNHSHDSRAQFPSHTEPRVWLITAGDSPIGISVARQVLAHGDYALLGLAHSVLERDERRRNGFDTFLAEVEEHRDEGWKQRMKAVPLDIRCALPAASRVDVYFECNSAQLHGHIAGIQELIGFATQDDGRMSGCSGRNSCSIWTSGHSSVLHKPRYNLGDSSLWQDDKLLTSPALIGTVEELSASQQTLNLVRDQFEVNYFGPLNIIKAALPHMRREGSGHIMILSGISKTL